MKVAFCSYMHVGLVAGGMYLQIQHTRNALQELGADVILHSPWENQIKYVDVLHCFGPFAQMLPLISEAWRHGKAIVWSPVMKHGAMAPWKFHLLAKAGRVVPGFWNQWKQLPQMAMLADGLVSLNSTETRLIERVFPAMAGKITEIPNGIDKRFANGDPRIFREKFGIAGEYVLHVGYFAPEKNQLTLIEAMKRIDCTLVLIGGPGSSGAEYLQRCKELAGYDSSVIFAGTFPAGSELLRSAYAGAKVFCLPSLFEVQPLTMMEAAVAGCHLVGSKSYPVMECLAGYMSRPDPNSAESISRAISEALTQTNTARNIMLAQPTWPDVAHMVFELYWKILERRDEAKRNNSR